MAKQGAPSSTKPSVFDQMREFLLDVKAEMSKVAWPSKDELKVSTSVVLLLLVVLAIIVGVYDFIFQKGVMLLTKLG